MNKYGRSLSFATIKVAHYGDILTDFTTRHNAVLLLPQLSLIDGYSHMILQVIPSKKEMISEFLDVSRSYTDVKYAEILNIPGLPQSILVAKRNYGVLKAIHKTGGVRTGFITVERGFKYFPVLIPQDSKSRLIKYVESFSPCEVSARLLGPSMAFKNDYSIQLLSEYELWVLRMAYEEGYFEWPRKIRLEELAGRLGVSKATAAEHLRKALKKILRAYIVASSSLNSR